MVLDFFTKYLFMKIFIILTQSYTNFHIHKHFAKANSFYKVILNFAGNLKRTSFLRYTDLGTCITQVLALYTVVKHLLRLKVVCFPYNSIIVCEKKCPSFLRYIFVFIEIYNTVIRCHHNS